MWLTSWWVAWLLNFYGFSHTNRMVFNRTPWTRYGIPWNSIGTSENPMEFHGPPRRLHGISWHSMELHHYIMELRGIPWRFMELHGYSLELHGIPRNSIDTPWTFRGIPWNSMDFHRFPWNSMRYFTQVLTVSSNEKCQLFYGWTRSSGMQNPHLFPLLPPHPE